MRDVNLPIKDARQKNSVIDTKMVIFIKIARFWNNLRIIYSILCLTIRKAIVLRSDNRDVNSVGCPYSARVLRIKHVC